MAEGRPGGVGRPGGEGRPEGEGFSRLGMNGPVVDTNASYVVARVEVVTGMETDLYIEIMGQGLRPGMMVANNPALVNDGDVVKIGLNNSGFRNTGGAGSGGGMGGFRGPAPAVRIGG